VLVDLLRSWVDNHDIAFDELLFRTRNGRRPTESNWNRALKRACGAAGAPPIKVYDGRHAAATTWLGARLALGEAARRLGHSVETLVSTYVGAIDGDDTAANSLVESLLAGDPGSALPTSTSS
jgi:integrase